MIQTTAKTSKTHKEINGRQCRKERDKACDDPDLLFVNAAGTRRRQEGTTARRAAIETAPRREQRHRAAKRREKTRKKATRREAREVSPKGLSLEGVTRTAMIRMTGKLAAPMEGTPPWLTRAPGDGRRRL